MRKTRKKRISKSDHYIVNSKHLGKEPEFKQGHNLSEIEKMNTFNWYNSMEDNDTALEYIIDYMNISNREDEIHLIKKVPEIWINHTAAWIARIICNGYEPGETTRKFLEDSFEKMYSHIEIKKEEPEFKDNIPKRFSNKPNLEQIIGDIEKALDSSLDNFNIREFITNNSVSVANIKKIIEYYSPMIEELFIAYYDEDSQMKEAYSNISKSEIKNKILKLNSMIKNMEAFTKKKNK